MITTQFCLSAMMGAFQISHPHALKITHHIEHRAALVPPALTSAIMAKESSLNHNAISPTGAKGLMQLTAIAVAEVRRMYDVKMALTSPSAFDMLYLQECQLPEELNLFKIGHNIQAGTCYLALLRSRYTSDVEVIAAYNGGHEQVKRLEAHLPLKPETHVFVLDVLAYRKQFSKKECQDDEVSN
jgi:soluble lytic murein transglycosylase-like protein